MKHLDTCMIWNKLTNIQAHLDDKTTYLWCTLYLEMSYLPYLSYNRTAKFSWDFSRTWLISESLPGLLERLDCKIKQHRRKITRFYWYRNCLCFLLHMSKKKEIKKKSSQSCPCLLGCFHSAVLRMCSFFCPHLIFQL